MQKKATFHYCCCFNLNYVFTCVYIVIKVKISKVVSLIVCSQRSEDNILNYEDSKTIHIVKTCFPKDVVGFLLFLLPKIIENYPLYLCSNIKKILTNMWTYCLNLIERMYQNPHPFVHLVYRYHMTSSQTYSGIKFFVS